MPDAKLIKQFRLQVNTDLEALTVVLQWFEQIVTPLIPKSVFWQCQVALAEGFTNTVRHAHKNLPPTTTIDLEVNVFSSCLEIKIWNWGEPFDLDSALRSLPDQNHNLLDEEGRGLLFMQNLTDELQYIRVPQKSARSSQASEPLVPNSFGDAARTEKVPKRSPRASELNADGATSAARGKLNSADATFARGSESQAASLRGSGAAPQGRNCLIMRKKISLYSLESG